MLVSICVLVFLATYTVWLGSVISASNSLLSVDPDELESVDMTLLQALTIPITSSIFLLLLFFFFEYAQYIMVLLIMLGCASATYHLTNLGLRNLFDVNDKVGVAVSLCTTVLILCYWAATGDIILHNLLGCALCIQFISTLRFPSLKIAVVCLSLLMVYDIFWVFFSEYFFEKNVMVSVATKVAANPIYEVGKHMHMAMGYVKPTMELPIKLMIPNFENGRMMMLGLGDVALPGALVSLAVRCDQAIQSTNDTDPTDLEAPTLPLKISNKPVPVTGLFQHAMVGYFMGLVGAFVGNFLSAHAQPALIYLVPAVLLAIVGRALAVGRLQDVWAGPVKVQQSS